VIRGTLPPGLAGTRATLALMRELGRRGAADPFVRDQALSILRSAGVHAHDFAGEIKALFEFVRDRIRFTRDPVDVETLQIPRRTLEVKAGDCDDKATLLVALLRAVGNPAELRYRVIGTSSPQFSHVYVVARVSGQLLAMDPTREGTEIGWQYPQPKAVQDFAA
jgi:transglutaminase-like putative cysteine protease